MDIGERFLLPLATFGCKRVFFRLNAIFRSHFLRKLATFEKMSLFLEDQLSNLKCDSITQRLGFKLANNESRKTRSNLISEQGRRGDIKLYIFFEVIGGEIFRCID